MKNSAVIDLQEMAGDSSSDIVSVLMKAKTIAFKLDLSDITDWIELELRGYPSKSSVPDYRLGQGKLKAWNPFRGWIPVGFGNVSYEIYQQCSTFALLEPVAALKRTMDRDMGTLRLPVSRKLVHMMNADDPDAEVCWFFSAAILDQVFSTIRNKILEWALQLEKKGILGEGLIFSQHDKEEAKHVTITNNNTINNHGNGVTMIGDMENTNSVVGGTVSHVHQQNITGDFSALERQLKEHGVDDSDITELKGVIDQTPKPESKEEVEKGFGAWIGKMTGKAFTGAIKIAGAAAPAILTNAICQYFGIDV